MNTDDDMVSSENESDKKETEILFDSAEVVPQPWQKDFIDWAMTRINNGECGLLLADAMGLGKTLQTAMLIKEYLERRQQPLHAIRVLIVVPVSLVNTWKLEYQRMFPTESIHVCHGSGVKASVKAIPDTAVFVITTYEYIAGIFNVKPNKIFSRRWTFLIADEARRLRNGIRVKISSALRLKPPQQHRKKKNTEHYSHGRKPLKLFESMCTLSAQADIKIALSGTPFENSISDLISLCVFLHVSGYTSVDEWKKRCEGRSMMNNPWIRTLRERVFIRRTNTVLNLPEQKERVRLVEASPSEYTVLSDLVNNVSRLKEAYTRCRDAAKNRNSEDEDDDSGAKEEGAPSAKTMMSMILVQIKYMTMLVCSVETLILSEQRKIKSGNEKRQAMLSYWQGVAAKINGPSTMVLSVIEQLRVSLFYDPKCTKIIIFTPFELMIEVLSTHIPVLLPEYSGPLVKFSGKLTAKKRNAVLHEFRNNPDCRVMMMTLESGGVGLTLIEANYLIFCGSVYNPSLIAQAKSRVYRFGQKNPVRIFVFLIEKTVEDWMLSVRGSKKQNAELFLNDGSAVAEMETQVMETRMLSEEAIANLYTKFVKVIDVHKMQKTLEHRAKKRQALLQSMTEEERDAFMEERRRRRGRRSRKIKTNGESSDEWEHPCGNGILSSEDEEDSVERRKAAALAKQYARSLFANEDEESIDSSEPSSSYTDESGDSVDEMSLEDETVRKSKRVQKERSYSITSSNSGSDRPVMKLRKLGNYVQTPIRKHMQPIENRHVPEKPLFVKYPNQSRQQQQQQSKPPIATSVPQQSEKHAVVVKTPQTEKVVKTVTAGGIEKPEPSKPTGFQRIKYPEQEVIRQHQPQNTNFVGTRPLIATTVSNPNARPIATGRPGLFSSSVPKPQPSAPSEQTVPKTTESGQEMKRHSVNMRPLSISNVENHDTGDRILRNLNAYIQEVAGQMQTYSMNNIMTAFVKKVSISLACEQPKSTFLCKALTDVYLELKKIPAGSGLGDEKLVDIAMNIFNTKHKVEVIRLDAVWKSSASGKTAYNYAKNITSQQKN